MVHVSTLLNWIEELYICIVFKAWINIDYTSVSAQYLNMYVVKVRVMHKVQTNLSLYVTDNIPQQEEKGRWICDGSKGQV